MLYIKVSFPYLWMQVVYGVERSIFELKNAMLKISRLQRKCEKLTELFGHIRKRQYLCTRFREISVFLFPAARQNNQNLPFIEVLIFCPLRKKPSWKTYFWVTLKISQLQRKCKKVAWKFGQSKNKQYLCTRFRPKTEERTKAAVIFERLSIIQDVVQESTKVLREKDTRNCNKKFPSSKYTIKVGLFWARK